MSWLGRLFRRRKLDGELDAELQFHVEQRAEEFVGEGVEPGEARRRALMEFGGVERAKEECREARGTYFVESVMRDARYGLRMLRRSPGFTAVAIVTLALGIGANTAIFSLIDAVMFRTLPVPNPRQLALFTWATRVGLRTDGGGGLPGCPKGIYNCTFPYPAFQAIHREQESFSGTFALMDSWPMLVGFRGHGRQAQGAFVSGDFFPALGVRSALGRMLGPGDDSLSAPPAIVLSHGLWDRQFNGDPGILGKTIYLNRHPFTVAGVTAAGFYGLNAGQPSDFWVPMAFEPTVDTTHWSMTDSKVLSFSVFGRLKPGVSIAQAQAATRGLVVRTLTSSWDSLEKPASHTEFRLVDISAGLDSLRQNYSQSLLLLLIVTGIILLLASANVAGLALARAARREKELAVRLALGTTGWRLIRQLLTESLLLACAGGVLGILLAYWGASSLVAFLSANSQGLAAATAGSVAPLAIDVQPDLRVLAFAVGVTVLVGILAGLVPAIRATRVDLAPTLKENFAPGSRGKRPWRRMTVGGALVVAQVALSILVLAGAGLLVRSLVNRETVSVGFPTKNLLTFAVDPTMTGMKDPQLVTLYRQLQAQLSRLPRVASVSYSSEAPLEQGSWWAYSIVGKPSRWVSAWGNTKMSPMVRVVGVGPDFLKMLGVPVVAGRGFTAADFDTKAKPQPVIVDQAFVKLAFGKENPLGGELEGTPSSPNRIVGVMRDVSYGWLPIGKPHPYLGLFGSRGHPPLLIYPLRGGAASFEIRTSASPEPLIPAIRGIVAQANSELVMTDVETVTQRIDMLLYQERLIGWLSSLFALLALALACIGLYGLLAWEVARRTREIGIRVALGAGRENILGLVLWRGVKLAAVGAIAGLGLAYGLTRLLRHFLFGVSATDPASFAAVAAVLLVTAFLACWIPARRAMRVDPMTALRHE